MARSFRVTAPYVTLKIKDPLSGTAMVNGFYTGAIVTDDRVDEASLKRHIDRGWVEAVEQPAPEVAKEPESNQDKVPDGTADKVLAWVGDDPSRAATALAAEQKSAKPRTTLVDQLTRLTVQA